MLSEYLRDHLTNKFDHVDPQELQIALREFERFAILGINSPGIFFPCSRLIDEIWHEAILETREYALFCQKLKPESFLHHSGISFTDYMSTRTTDDQDSEGLSVLASYVKNFGPFEEASAKYWVVASNLMITNNWSINDLNIFLHDLLENAIHNKSGRKFSSLETTLQTFHQTHAGTTETYFSRIKTSITNLNTYHIIANICSRSSTTASPNVLDIGCGIGTLFKYLTSKFEKINYLGIDISLDEINIGRSLIDSEHASLICANANQIPFNACHFDIVISHMTLHLLSDTNRVFSEIFRTLKPRGELYFTIPSAECTTVGEQIYQKILLLLRNFQSNDEIMHAKANLTNPTDTLLELSHHFGNHAQVAHEYSLHFDPLDADLMDHFTGLYSFATLNENERELFRKRAELEIASFAKSYPGTPLERRMVIYKATKVAL